MKRTADSISSSHDDEQAMPQRILMTADTVGGVWTYAIELTRALETYGIEVFLATMGRTPSEEQCRQARERPNLRLFKSEYKLEWMQDCWRDVSKAGEWLLHLERRIKPDLIHLNGYCHARLPFAAPKLVVAHSCVLSWWSAVRRTPIPDFLETYKQNVAAGLDAADIVVAPTRAMLDEIERHYCRLNSKAVIYNGRAACEFTPQRKMDIILSAGRLWDEAKNVAVLTRLPRELASSVFLAGDTEAPDCESEVTRYDNGNLMGRLSTGLLQQWMSRAAIYAMPALYEPFGLSILEAALSGCALVLGDIPTLRELWDGHALFVAPEDQEGWATQITRLMKDKRLRVEYGQRALARAQDFSRENMGRGYVDAYRVVTQPVRSIRQEAIPCA
jgi:glycogen synthase